MRNKAIDMNQPIFQPVKQAAKTTGLSEWFLRQALKKWYAPPHSHRHQSIGECSPAVGRVGRTISANTQFG